MYAVEHQIKEKGGYGMVVQSQFFDSDGDRHLIAAFQAGDADVFAQIVGLHRDSLAAEARRRLRSSDDAEDAVQETLLRAYLALDRFGGEYRLHAWLSRILTNVCADTGNRRAAEIRLVDRLGPPRDEAPPADEGIGDAERRRAVKEAVDSLPDSYRMAFVLREIEERSYAEVAEEMGISEANARARVHRARKLLARALRPLTVLGGFPIPWHLFGLKRLMPHVALEKLPFMSPCPTKSRVATMCSDISASVPTAYQSSLPTVLQVPLSEASSAAAYAASGPLSQTLIAGASVVWHAALPVAAALATVAASAAMVGSGAIASGPDTPTPTTNSQVILAPSTSDLASYGNTPPTAGQISAPSAASSTSVSSAPSSTPSSASTTSPGGTASTSASDPWSWVQNAASGGGGGGDPASTSGPSGSQDPTQTASNTASAGATPPVNCPWNGFFPGVPNGTIALPPPEPADAVASSHFSSDTFNVGTAGPAFEVSGLGQLVQGANTVTLHADYGACLPATTQPELMANLSNPADSTIGELQLRGALVDSRTDPGETIAYYRGTSVWVDGPNASTAPLVFVAQVMLAEPTNTSTLLLAFFGPALTFTESPACADSGDAQSSPTTSTQGPAAPATSTSPSTASGAGASAGSDPSSGSNSISGSSPTSSSNCDPSASDPSSSTGGQTNATSDSVPSPRIQTSTSSSSYPQGSVTGSTSSDAALPGATASSDPVSSPTVADSAASKPPANTSPADSSAAGPTGTKTISSDSPATS
jgi:RNA polymerase sigma-70 factor (ECF subfamily)